MFFATLGWLILVIIALGFMVGGSALFLFAAAWESKSPWPVIFPVAIGGTALYFLFVNAPFHIVLS